MKKAIISEKEIRHDETNPKIEESSSKEKESSLNKEKSTYECRFCKRQGHKAATCRYKRRKEKAKRLKEQAQKQKSEQNFKTFVKEQITNLINEVKEALSPILKLDETIKKFTHFEHRIEEFCSQKQEKAHDEKKEQPKINKVNQTFAPKELQQHEEHDQSAQDENDDEYEYELAQPQQDEHIQQPIHDEYSWERELNDPTQNQQHHEDEDTWTSNETPTGFGEQIKQTQDQKQFEEDDERYSWEKEIKQPTKVEDAWNEEDAWKASNEESTGFGEQAIRTQAQGENKIHRKQKESLTNKIHNRKQHEDRQEAQSHRTIKEQRKALRCTHSLADREVDPSYWYVYKPEENQQALMLRKARIITNKEEYNFYARRLWINKNKQEEEYTYAHAEDFRLLNEAETKQAILEINFLNNKVKNKNINH